MMLRIGKTDLVHSPQSTVHGNACDGLSTMDCRPDSGFSLIELMLTISFVMMGALLLQGSYMRSAEIYGRYAHSLSSMVWMEEQLSKAKEALLTTDDYPPSENGTIQDGGKTIDWVRATHSTAVTNLYSVGMILSWKEGPKSVQMEGEQYVYKRPTSASL